MPREVHPPAKPNGKNPKVKGKPLGIPMWGWIAGAVLGLVIGYILIKNRGSSASDSGTGSSPLAGDQSSGSGGGVVASPPPASASPFDLAGLNDQPIADNTQDFSQPEPASSIQSGVGGFASPTGTLAGEGIFEPSQFQPQGAGGSAVQTSLASGAGYFVPSIISNPTPPTGNISPFNPNLPRHALNIAAS
jgi:hypothetical protein